LVIAYTSIEQVLVGLDPLRIITPELGLGKGKIGAGSEVASAGLGGLGLGGVGGYMTMGLGGAKVKARVVRAGEGEVLIDREGEQVSELLWVGEASSDKTHTRSFCRLGRLL
jgi:hypothetical protein